MSKEFIGFAKSVSPYCVGMEGNISQKINDQILIKASGSKLSDLTISDIVTYDLAGNQIGNLDKKGSMELGFHLGLLGYENINFVSHTHPVNTLSLLSTKYAKTFANERIFPDQVIFNGSKSLLIDYVKPGDDLWREIKKKLDKFINKWGVFPKLILLKNHGMITCGKTIDECIISTQICEKAAEIFTKTMKETRFLKKKHVRELLNDDKEKYRILQLK